MKKGGTVLLEYMKKMIEDSQLVDKLEPERDASIDYLQAYRLVDQKKIDVYARAFVVEDENKSGILKYEVISQSFFLHKYQPLSISRHCQ